VPPPEAARVTGVPTQALDAEDVAVATGNGFTVIVTVLVELHPFISVPTTVYVVVPTADETGLAVVAPDKEPAGDQAYPTAPEALKEDVDPTQIEAEGPTVIRGNEFTFTVTNAVSRQPEDAVPTTV
jgi:hypothetical protein